MFDKILEELAKTSKVGNSICLEEGNHFIECSKVLSKGKVENSDDPKSRMIIRALVSEDVKSLRDLIRGLKHAFEEALAWNQFTTRKIELFNQVCILHFIISAQEKKYTTGIIVIGGNNYMELVRRRNKNDQPNLKDCKTVFDFSDLEEPVSEEEGRFLLKSKNWKDDEPIIEEIQSLLLNLEELEKLSLDEFSKSRVSQDSTLFNIQLILRASNRISSGYDDLREARRELVDTFYPSGMPCRNNPDKLWSDLKSLSKLRWIVKKIVSKNKAVSGDLSD